MKFTFYTPSYKNAEGFGAATFGFAGLEDETQSNVKTFNEDISGTMILGSYDEVLEQIPEGPWQAAIVLIGNAGGENEFVRALAKKVKAPLAGGSGAICPKTGESALITGRGQAAVFLINDDRYDVTVVSENVHYDVLSEHKITFNGRFIDAIDGIDAISWYEEKRKEFDLPEGDFEHLTLTDPNGINAHLSINNGKLFAGRDLDETMTLRFLPMDKAQERIEDFYDDENAVVFGCAGLKQTLTKGLETDGLGLFMFGEICTVNGVSDFGNLMLSKVVFKKK